MGCDIHIITEIRQNGSWVRVEEIPEVLENRNYSTFAFLAGVRNRFNTKGFEAKGEPDDMSEDTKGTIESWKDDAHSHSYLSLQELVNKDKTDYISIKCKVVKDFVDEKPAKELYLSQKQIQRIKDFYGIKSFVVSEHSCFDLYNRNIRNDGISITILSPEHNKLRLVEPTGPDGVEIVRKYSVTEQFRLMGFKDGEINFAEQSYTQLSKRAANGWDVNLVGILLKHIWRQL